MSVPTQDGIVLVNTTRHTSLCSDRSNYVCSRKEMCVPATQRPHCCAQSTQRQAHSLFLVTNHSYALPRILFPSILDPGPSATMFGFSFLSLFRRPVSEPEVDPLAGSCCICFRTYSAGPEPEDPIQLACGHVFGTSCIDTWAETSGTCPMCRAKLDFADDRSSIYEEASATPARFPTSRFSHNADFSCRSGALLDGDSDSDVDSQAGSEEGDIWLSALEDISTLEQPLITPDQVSFSPTEGIWITARHDLVTPWPSLQHTSSRLFDEEETDASDSFDDLQ